MRATGTRDMITIRRAIGGLCALLAVSVTLAACGSSGSSGSSTNGSASEKPEGTLTIVAETEVLEPSMLKPFEAANPDIKIQSLVVEGSNEAATKLSAGFKADLVETCADESDFLTTRDLLQPVDVSKLSHWGELISHMRSAPGVMVDGKELFVPGQAGPMGIVYNTKAFPQGVDTDRELFNPKLKGKVALDIGGDDKSMLAFTAFALGIKNPFAMSPQQLMRVRKYLVAHASQFRTFPNSDANQLSLMKGGDVIMETGGLGLQTEMVKAGLPTKWVGPKEGYYSWICGLAITKDAANLPAAYAFLNYYTSARAQAVFADMGYTVLNRSALPLVKPKYRATADPESLAGATVETQPTKTTQKEWLEAFQEVVSG